MPFQLSCEYETAFDDMLLGLTEGPDAAQGELTAFWPMAGHRYDGRLLVVGQAVNGWETKFTTPELRNQEQRGRTVRKARRVAERGICDSKLRCPMLWVTDQWTIPRNNCKTGSSGFWRVTRLTTDALGLGNMREEDWPSGLGWTNLYKVAPWDGGNPDAKLQADQRASATKLLALEIMELKPSRVLVLTGRDWFMPFANNLGIDMADGNGEVVQGTALSLGAKWVLTRYPARLPRGVTESIFADRVVEAFSRL